MQPGILDSTAMLLTYILLIGAAFFASIVLGRRARPEGRETMIDDPDRIATLAGGADRLMETAVTRLLASGALELSKRGIPSVTGRAAADRPLDARILALPYPVPWSRLVKEARIEAQGIESGLTEAGLLSGKDALSRWRLVRTAPLLLIAGVGILLCLAAPGEAPVPFGWIAAVILACFLTFVRAIGGDRKTASGLRILEKLRARHDRLRKEATPEGYPLGVALFGTVVLAGTDFAGFHQLRAASDSSSDSGGAYYDSGGSDGGGGGD